MSFHIVATADNHLGRYYARMPLRTLEERRRRLRQALGRVIDYAIETRADLLVLAGDVFDTPGPRNPDRVYLARRLYDLAMAGVPVIAVGGNHDTPRGSSEQGGYLPLNVYAELGALQFFDQLPEDGVVQPVPFATEDLRIAVGGFTPSPNLGPEHDPLTGITFADPGADVRVLVAHGPIQGLLPPDVPSAVISRLTIEQLKNIDLLIAGDIHQRAAFILGGKQVVVPGATEQLDFGSADTLQPGFAVVEVAGRADITVHYESIPPQPRVEIAISTAQLEADDPNTIILAQLQAHADAEALARLTLTGTLSREAYMRLNSQAIDVQAQRLFFFFETDLSELRVRFGTADPVATVGRRSIAEEIMAVIESQMAQATDEERNLLAATRQELLATLETLHES